MAIGRGGGPRTAPGAEYPFAVRGIDGAESRTMAAADILSAAYGYLSGLFDGFRPEIVLVVADAAGWPGVATPYGMPFFREDTDNPGSGMIVMPAGAGAFWHVTVEQIRRHTPQGFDRLCAAYPGVGGAGVNLQPFFDLVAVHELGHAFETAGGLRLPTLWLGEIFANLSLHAFMAVKRPAEMATLETLSQVGVSDGPLTERLRATGVTSLDAFDRHYAGADDQMSTANYLWFQYRFQRLAAETFDADGEAALTRFWTHFRHHHDEPASACLLAPRLGDTISRTFGDTVTEW